MFGNISAFWEWKSLCKCYFIFYSYQFGVKVPVLPSQREEAQLWISLVIDISNFFTAPNFEHVLAVANEEGFVRLYDTEAQNTTKLISKGKYYMIFIWSDKYGMWWNQRKLYAGCLNLIWEVLASFHTLQSPVYRAAMWVCSYKSNGRWIAVCLPCLREAANK